MEPTMTADISPWTGTEARAGRDPDRGAERRALRPTSRVRPLSIALLLLSLPAAAPGQGDRPVISGLLLDDRTGDPVAAGEVSVLAIDSSEVVDALTGDEGLFRLTLPRSGTFRLRAERVGYRTADSKLFYVMPGDTIQIEFRLGVAAVVVDPIRVTASARPWGDRFGLVRMEGFFDRYARYSGSGFAEFLTRDSIARFEDRVPSTGQMLRWTTRSVRRVDPASGHVTLRNNCTPVYYLNGSRVPYAMVEPLGPTMLEAVEVYIQPAIPAELGAGTPCGVVSYWSRQSPPDELPRSPIGRIAAVALLGGGLLLLLLMTLQ